MASASSLLASLTSSALNGVDDVAVDEPVANNDSSTSQASSNNKSPVLSGSAASEEVNPSDFLSASGLLPSTNDNGHTNGGGSGVFLTDDAGNNDTSLPEEGGLFAEVDQEEEEKLRREQQELRMQREKEMEVQMERERELARHKSALAKEKEEEEYRQRQLAAAATQQQLQQNDMNQHGHLNAVSGMQELTLDSPPPNNDMSSMGYRSHGPPVPNGNGMGGYSNTMPLPGHNGNNGGYSNTTQVPNGYQQQEQYVNGQQTQQQQQQQIQQAGFGAASYFYSNTGNNATNLTPNNNNGMMPQPPQQQPPVASNNGHQPTSMSMPVQQPPSGPPPPVPPQQPIATTTSNSYAARSQNMNGNGMAQTHPTLSNQPQTYSSTMMSSQQPSLPQTTHPSSQQHQQQQPNQYSNPNNNMMMNPNNPPQQQQQQQMQSPPKPKAPLYNPANFKPSHGRITVTDPILVQSPGVFAGPPHWTYNVSVQNVDTVANVEGEVFAAVGSSVRRRFRHFVALEERLRTECPGAILPPRPDKHPTRAIDEATTRQSSEFALQRTTELENYLNQLRLHPIAGNASNLRLFLTLPDHIGVAWPEVSSSIFTRLTDMGTTTAVKVAEGTSAVMSELSNDSQAMAGEDNAQLLSLANSEGVRIGSVLQAVPKVEGTIALYGELGNIISVTGLEIQKLSNQVVAHDQELGRPFDIMSSGLLRSGRRTTRLAVELSAAGQTFIHQLKLCKYERLAFGDRRAALVSRKEKQKEAEKRAQKFVLHQHSLQSMGRHGMMDQMQNDASMTDEFSVEASREADEVGLKLELEVARIAEMRKREWSENLRVMAANMKEACAENRSIWESCYETFKNELSSDLSVSNYQGGGATVIGEQGQYPSEQGNASNAPSGAEEENSGI